MTDSKPVGKSFRDSLKGHAVKIVGIVTIAAGGLVGAVHAETFNFTILTDLADALVALIPSANALVNQGGPLVINICIVGAICAPFIWIFLKAHSFK